MILSKIRLFALAGLTGLGLMAFYSHAQPVIPSRIERPTNKVIIYPTGSENIDQLKAKGFTVIHNYGSYWLVEATDAGVKQLAQMYGSRAVAASDLNMIRLRNLSFDPTKGSPAIPIDLRQKEVAGKNLRLIQFYGPVVPQWLEQIHSAGDVEVVCYVPNNAYLVRIDQSTEKKLQALEALGGPIQWMGDYRPYYKIDPGLSRLGSRKDDPLLRVHVMLAPHSKSSATMEALQKVAAVDYSYDRANLTTLFMTVPMSTVTQIAKLPDVVWIEREYPKKLLDEVQDLVLGGQTNGVGHGPEGATTGFTNYLDFLFTQVAGNLTNTFIDPLTYPVVDVADTGIDSGPLGGSVIFGTNPPVTVEPPVHPAFHEFGDARNFSRVVYYGPPWIGGDPAVQLGCSVYLGANDGPFKHIESMDLVGHGTAVASIIGGFDDGTNTLNKPCLQLVSISNTWQVAIPGTTSNLNTGATMPTQEVDPITGQPVTIPGGFCSTLGSSGGTASFSVLVPIGFTNTCG